MNMQRISPVNFSTGLTTRKLLWPDPVVHFTNYTAEAISESDRTKIDTAHHGGRPLITLARGDSVVCGLHELDLHKRMVQYHNDLGISTLRPSDIRGIPATDILTPICDDMLRYMKRDPAAVKAMINGAKIMLPVIVSPGTVSLARNTNILSETTAEVVDNANNKKFLPSAAKRFGFKSPPTLKPNNLVEAEAYFKQLMDIATDEPHRFDNKVWAKLCRSSGGEGVASFRSLPEFLDWLQNDENGKYFAKAMVSDVSNEGLVLQIGIKGRKEDAAPNINFYVGESKNKDRDLGASAQAIINESVHVGNNGMLSESDRNAISPIIAKVADWLRSIGFRGIAGIDVIMGVNGEIWVIDINARWNASTSTVMLFNDLQDMSGVGVFRYTGKIRVPRKVTVDDFVAWIDSQNASFKPNRGGVIPINFMTAYHSDPSKDSYVAASIFGPNHETVSNFFDLAQMER